jgi:hypothetical protein
VGAQAVWERARYVMAHGLIMDQLNPRLQTLKHKALLNFPLAIMPNTRIVTAIDLRELQMQESYLEFLKSKSNKSTLALKFDGKTGA